MARKREVTEDQVLKAANDLAVEGKNINGTSLRRKLERGRPNVLMEMYNALKENGEILAPAEPDQAQQPMVQQELPPEVSEKLSVMLADIELLVRQINDHAHNIVEQRLNNAIAEANERAASAAKREAESIEEQDKAFEDLEDALESIDELNDTVSQVKAECAHVNAALDVARSETKAALDTVAERDARLAKQQQQLSEMQEALSKAESDKAQAQGKALSLEQRLAEQTDELKQLNTALAQSQKETASAEARIEALNVQVEAESKKHEMTQKALQKVEKQAELDKVAYQSHITSNTKALENEAARYEQLHNKLEAQQKEHMTETKDLRAEYDKQVTALNDKHGAQVTELQNKVVELTEKSAVLAEQIKRNKTSKN